MDQSQEKEMSLAEANPELNKPVKKKKTKKTLQDYTFLQDKRLSISLDENYEVKIVHLNDNPDVLYNMKIVTWKTNPNG